MIPFIDLKPQYEALKNDLNQSFQKIFDHGQYIMGPEVKESEEALAKFTGCRRAIVANNGTIALLMALLAKDIKPGDEIITTAFSFIATAEVIALLNAKPVYVDIDPHTYNLDPNKIEEAITDKTKAIMPVSLYGLPADFEAINAIAKKHNLTVIEDSAQSFGAELNGNKSGTLSDVSCTSFFPAKPLGVFGDGGAVLTDNEELADKIEQVRNHGSTKRYYHPFLGINGRLNSLQCAVLLLRLQRYPQEIENRNTVAQLYNEAFNDIENIQNPNVPEGYKSVWAQYTVSVENRDQFQSRLKELGVPTAVHYPLSMPDQPAYKELGRCMDIPNARRAAESVISLPMYADMPTDHTNKVIDAVKKALT